MLHFGIKQAFRTPRRLAAYFLVVAVVCSFLCIGLNLKKAADVNLQNILSNFNVVALPDFQASINESGKLTAVSQDSIGYLQCRAEGYDVDALRELPGVKTIDTRNQFGACVDGMYPYITSRQSSQHYESADVVIFRIKNTKPVTILGWQKTAISNFTATQQTLSVEILWSAAGQDLTLNNLRVLNPSSETYLLEPGKVYIMNLGNYAHLTGDIYHNSDQMLIGSNGAYYWEDNTSYVTEWAYPPVTEYYDGFWDTDIGRFYRQSAEACYLQANSLTAITTSDVNLIPSWANGEVYLKNGCTFSQEDYERGNRVCIVSQHLLEATGWKIGDTVDFSFYEAQYTLNRYIRGQYSFYDPHLFVDGETLATGENGDYPLDHIFDENTYTIIGTYDGKVCWRDDHESYLFNESMHWQMVLFPEKSIQNQPAPKLSQYMTTIQIEPMMIQKFLAAAQASGLMDEQPYGYQLGLTIDDHGLSGMISGLESLQQVSRLTLMLASITAALAVLVLAILHLLQNRKQIAVLRSMGVRKGQVTACVLAGILVVCVLGAALGAWCGEKLAETVTQRILDTAQAEALDSSFSAMLAVDDDETDDFQLSAAADPKLTYWTAGLVSAAMVLVSVTLVLWEAKKPPLLMLGVKE